MILNVIFSVSLLLICFESCSTESIILTLATRVQSSLKEDGSTAGNIKVYSVLQGFILYSLLAMLPRVWKGITHFEEVHGNKKQPSEL